MEIRKRSGLLDCGARSGGRTIHTPDRMYTLKEKKMKFGYLRKDGDNHWFLIPEALVNQWDEETGDGDAPEDYEKWNEYREDGVKDLKIVMPE